MTRRDRDFYRGFSDKELLDEVNYAINPDWHELAIVLAERLKTLERENSDLRWRGRHYDEDD